MPEGQGGPKAKESGANLRRYAPPPSRGRRENAASQAPHEEGLRYENAAFLALSFRAKARNLFRSRSSKKREESGKRETRYSKRVGITVLHVDSITKEKGNGKRKRSLGCARDDETRERLFPFLFNLLRKPTPPRCARQPLPREGLAWTLPSSYGEGYETGMALSST